MPEQLQTWDQLSAGEVAIQYGMLALRSFGTLYLIGLVFFFIERIRPAQPGSAFFKRDFRTELGYPIFNNLFTTPLLTIATLAMTAAILQPLVPHQPFASRLTALPMPLQVFVALLISDLGVYLEHRFAHRFLWPFHAIHHMTPEVSWLTHARVHPVNAFTIGLTPVLFFYVLGFNSDAWWYAGPIALFLAVWQHSNLDFAFPRPFNYLLVSPRFHRWHHASCVEAIDKNFCLIFPFLDLAFRTYYCPDRLPAEYGLYHGSTEPSQAKRVPEDFLHQMWHPFTEFFGGSEGSPSPVPAASLPAERISRRVAEPEKALGPTREA